MGDKVERKRLAILKILREEGVPLSSLAITDQLVTSGHEVSERTVRHHLQAMDAEGLTENLGRRGRVITDRGMMELASARIFDKVGYLAAKIDQLTYRMDFDLATRGGRVVVNVSLIRPEQLREAFPLMSKVFEKRLSMGDRLVILPPGERIGDSAIPEDRIGLGTVCSITINGVLLAGGVPVSSRFGGLMEVRNLRPTRFLQLIHYEGTTLDPLEIFIRSGMTDYVGATGNGNGIVGVGFREIPAEARDKASEISAALDAAGLGGIALIGWPGRPLLEIPGFAGKARPRRNGGTQSGGHPGGAGIPYPGDRGPRRAAPLRSPLPLLGATGAHSAVRLRDQPPKTEGAGPPCGDPAPKPILVPQSPTEKGINATSRARLMA